MVTAQSRVVAHMVYRINERGHYTDAMEAPSADAAIGFLESMRIAHPEQEYLYGEVRQVWDGEVA